MCDRYLKERNFRGKKISRIFAESEKLNSFLDPRKCRLHKLIPLKFFKNLWTANIGVSIWYNIFWMRSSEDHRLLCHLFKENSNSTCLDHSQNHKLRLYVRQTQNLSAKSLSLSSRKLIPVKSLVKPDSRKLIPTKSLVKPNSRKLILTKCLKKIRKN